MSDVSETLASRWIRDGDLGVTRSRRSDNVLRQSQDWDYNPACRYKFSNSKPKMQLYN